MVTRKTTGADFTRRGAKPLTPRAVGTKELRGKEKEVPAKKAATPRTRAAAKKVQDNTQSGAKTDVKSLPQDAKLTEYRYNLFDAMDRNPPGFRKEDNPDVHPDKSPLEVLEAFGKQRTFLNLEVNSLEADMARYNISKAYIATTEEYKRHEKNAATNSNIAGDVVFSGVLRGMLVALPNSTMAGLLHKASVNLIKKGYDVVMFALIDEKVVNDTAVADSFPASERPWVGTNPAGLAQPHSGGFGSSFGQRGGQNYRVEFARMGPEHINIDLINLTPRGQYYWSVLQSLFNHHSALPTHLSQMGDGTPFIVHQHQTNNFELETISAVLKTGIFADKTFVINHNTCAVWWAIASKSLRTQGLKVATFV